VRVSRALVPRSRRLQRASVDFAAAAPYDTLTPGAMVAFHAVSPHTPPRPSTYADIDAHSGPAVDTNAAHLAALNGRSASKRVRRFARTRHTYTR